MRKRWEEKHLDAEYKALKYGHNHLLAVRLGFDFSPAWFWVPLGPDALQTDNLVFDYCMACGLFSLRLGLARPWALRLVASYFSFINKDFIEHVRWIFASRSSLQWVLSCLSSSAVWLCYLPSQHLSSSRTPFLIVCFWTGAPRLLQPSRSCKVLHEIELRQCLASCFGWGRGTSGRQI